MRPLHRICGRLVAGWQEAGAPEGIEVVDQHTVGELWVNSGLAAVVAHTIRAYMLRALPELGSRIEGLR